MTLTGLFSRQVIDQQALNNEGKWIYKDPTKDKDKNKVYRTAKLSNKKQREKGLVENKTCKVHVTVSRDTDDGTNSLATIDGYKDVSNLAKTWDNKNGGPQYATETADAYAFFAMMA